MTDRSHQSPESDRDLSLPTFTGTEVGYYFVCKKKLWWFAHGVEMEHENDRVRMGRLVHAESYGRRKKELNVDDRIVLDWREDGIIHEVKLTDSMERARDAASLLPLLPEAPEGRRGAARPDRLPEAARDEGCRVDT